MIPERVFGGSSRQLKAPPLRKPAVMRKITLGYSLSSEEFGPDELVRQAVAAENSGFEIATISDHFHPWTRRQGNSPFVWCVLGAIAKATNRLRIATGVTCPIIRMH